MACPPNLPPAPTFRVSAEARSLAFAAPGGPDEVRGGGLCLEHRRQDPPPHRAVAHALLALKSADGGGDQTENSYTLLSLRHGVTRFILSTKRPEGFLMPFDLVKGKSHEQLNPHPRNMS